MRRAETVIVGGGPAGSATASGLAALGRDVVLIERTAKPHNKVCGEFLSVETQTQLQRLGVDPSSLGAVPVEQVALYSSSRSVTSALPFRALSLSRYRLDDALLQCAQNSGARLKRNVAVKSVIAMTPAGADGMYFAMTARRSIADISCWRPGSWACAASTTRATVRW